MARRHDNKGNDGKYDGDYAQRQNQSQLFAFLRSGFIQLRASYFPQHGSVNQYKNRRGHKRYGYGKINSVINAVNGAGYQKSAAKV